VRITVPRLLPTEDVLVVRKPRGKGKRAEPDSAPAAPAAARSPPPPRAEQALGVVTSLVRPTQPCAWLARDVRELEWLVARASSLAPALRVVVAPFVPSGWVTLLSACAVLSLDADAAQLSTLARARQLTLAAPERWRERVPLSLDGQTLELRWAATPEERR